MNTHSTTTKRGTSKSTYSQFFALFSKLQQVGYPQERDEMIYFLTDGRTESLKDLTSTEYQIIINWMNNEIKRATAQNTEKENRQKRKIIALFCQMGYVNNQKADMPRINGWCISHGHLKKTLNHYHGKDLIKLLNQADKVYESFIKSL